MTKDREAMELARELLRGSLLEDAAARFISQILKEAHDSRIKPMQERIEDLEAKLSTAVGLLSRAIGTTGEPHCYHDHHGYCQAHNLEPRGECWVEQSKAFLAELTGGKDRHLRDAIREALRLMERPDHGDANAMIANFLEAYDMLCTALEEESEE